jgi:lysophospholipase L1-like esterase
LSGLVALGDSITRGRRMAPMFGADPRSWAQWLAEAMELPFLNLAVDGAVVADIAREQLPRVRDGWDVAVLYCGVNDARGVAFSAADFERDAATLVTGLAQRAARLAVLTIPLDLGRPRAGADVATANAILRRLATEAGAVVVDLDDFGGWKNVLPDAVHPTSLGQLAIADRAATALGAPLPSSRADVTHSPGAHARYAAFYATQLAKDHLRRHRERT